MLELAVPLFAHEQNLTTNMHSCSPRVASAEKEHEFSVQSLVTPTSVALLAAAVLPEIAEAAQPGVSPSLKNLLLSVLAGGVVLGGIGIAVAGVSTFDPVKRGK